MSDREVTCRFVCALGAAFFAALGAGCDQDALSRFLRPEVDPAPRFSEQRKSTLIVGRPADALGLDPAARTDNESVEVTEQIYEHLVRYARDSTEVEPSLATRWQVSEGGKVWTFELRPDVQFHDGTPLTAEAVVFSLERQRNPSHPFHSRYFLYWWNSFRYIEGIEAVGPMQVRITLERPYAPFLASLAMFPVSIVSPAAVAKYGDEFERHPVGTGPFRLESWTRGDRVVLVRNERYWGPKPALERLVFRAIRDDRQRLLALESGSIDVAWGIQPEELQFVELHPELVLHHVPGQNVAYVAINTRRPPLDDVRVRRAINHAVNKVPIVKLVYQGLGIPAHGPLPPTMWSYEPNVKRYPYDPKAARALLEEAGVPKVRVFRFLAPSTPRSYLPDPEKVARVIQRNLAEVGIRTELVLQEFSVHQQAAQDGKHDLVLHGWVGDNGDPDNFLYVLFDRDNAVPGSAKNLAFYEDDRVHGLLMAAQQTMNRPERDAFYRRVQEHIASDAPWVPVAHSEIVVASHDRVKGLVLHPNGTIYYRLVELEP